MSVSSVVLTIASQLDFPYSNTQTGDHGIWMDMNRTSTGQVKYKYLTEQIKNGQWADNHWRVIRWLFIHNFEQTQNSAMDKLDINRQQTSMYM